MLLLVRLLLLLLLLLAALFELLSLGRVIKDHKSFIYFFELCCFSTDVRMAHSGQALELPLFFCFLGCLRATF